MSRGTVVMLSLQAVGPLLTLAFGVLALRIARETEPHAGRAGWLLSGVAFSANGVHSILQSTAAVWAVAAGEGSAVYTLFVRTLPAGNHARSLLVLAYAAAMLRLAGARDPGRLRAGPLAAGAVAILVAGSALGMLEGVFQPVSHFPLLAWTGVLVVIVLFAALYQALSGEAVDYLLWCAAALYAVREAMSAPIMAVLALMDFGVWTPSPYALMSVSIFFLALMVWLAAYRLGLARAGSVAPPLLPRLREGV